MPLLSPSDNNYYQMGDYRWSDIQDLSINGVLVKKRGGASSLIRRRIDWLIPEGEWEDPSLARRLQKRRWIGLIFRKIVIVQFPSQFFSIFFREPWDCDLDIFAIRVENLAPVALAQSFWGDFLLKCTSFIEYAYRVKHGVSLPVTLGGMWKYNSRISMRLPELENQLTVSGLPSLNWNQYRWAELTVN